MARSHGKLFSSIWRDEDWLALTLGAQWLYEALISQRKLSLIGLLEYLPHRWARLAANATVGLIEEAVNELEAKRFVAVDRGTDELLIRTLVRHDVAAGLANVNLLKGLWRAWEAIESPQLNAVAVDNIPESVWGDKRCQPPPEALQIRRSRRLGPPVQTNGSDQRLEPAVPTSLGPSTDYLPAAASTVHSTGNGGEGEQQQLIRQACEILTERHITENPSRHSPTRHRTKTFEGKLNDHTPRALTLLKQNPGITPERLAQLLEPSSSRPRPPEYQSEDVEGVVSPIESASKARELKRQLKGRAEPEEPKPA